MDSTNDTQNTSGLNTSSIEQKKEYYKLLDRLSLLDNDSVDNKQRVEGTMQVLQEAKSLANVVASNTSAVLLDSYVLRQAGQQALTAVRNIEANTNVYNPAELAQHIRENPSLWQFILPRRVASAATLHGSLKPPPPPQRRAPRTVQRSAALSRPDNIATGNWSEQSEDRQRDTAMVSRVLRFIKRWSRQRPLSYFHCVLDPGSFARTVQNIYYVSFLVRDGRVAVYLDEERGVPLVRAVRPTVGEQRDIARENQFVVSIDEERWRRLIEACGIEKPMMTVYEEAGDGRVMDN